MNKKFHQTIIKKLEFFISIKKIPNIIFHGPSGSGKRTLVHNFITDIYHNDKELIKAYVMDVNCAHGKGIKFVREDLKFFAKTHINMQGMGHFKTVILSNADKLTIDAQSALRRCIELFSHNTRFFIIVEDKYKLLKPILSRFCEIFVAEPIIDGKHINMHRYVAYKKKSQNNMEKKKQDWLKKTLAPHFLETDYAQLLDLSVKLYDKCYSGLDLIKFIELNNDLGEKYKYQLLITCNKVKREFKNEKLLLLFIMHFLFLRSELNLENISFM